VGEVVGLRWGGGGGGGGGGRHRRMIGSYNQAFE